MGNGMRELLRGMRLADRGPKGLFKTGSKREAVAGCRRWRPGGAIGKAKQYEGMNEQLADDPDEQLQEPFQEQLFDPNLLTPFADSHKVHKACPDDLQYWLHSTASIERNWGRTLSPLNSLN